MEITDKISKIKDAYTKFCYSCNVELVLDKNNPNYGSPEHIIPNSCGGRFTSKNILCKTCNSIFGHSIDKKLAYLGNFFMNNLMLSRQRGKVQPVIGATKSGHKYKINELHKPTLTRPIVEETIVNNGTQIKITASSEKQLLQELKRLQKTYSDINIEDASSKINLVNSSIDEPILTNLKLGVEELKAILKIAVNLYVNNGYDISYIQNSIQLLNNNEVVSNVRLYYPDSLVYECGAGEISHIIYLKSDTTQNVLYAYVELFSTLKYVIKLSDNYMGNDIDDCYVYELIEQKALYNKNINLRVNKNLFNEVNASLTHKINECFSRVRHVSGMLQTSDTLAKEVARNPKNICKILVGGLIPHLNIPNSGQKIIHDFFNL